MLPQSPPSPHPELPLLYIPDFHSFLPEVYLRYFLSLSQVNVSNFSYLYNMRFPKKQRTHAIFLWKKKARKGGGGGGDVLYLSDGVGVPCVICVQSGDTDLCCMDLFDTKKENSKRFI